METQTSIGERITMIIDRYHLNKNSFSLRIKQESNSLIVKVTNDPSMTLGLKILQKILIAFPDIDARWLIMGEGNMLSGPNFPDPNLHYIKYYHGWGDEPTDMMRVFGYEECTHAYDVVGDMMAPKFRTSDIIICQEADLSSHINFGEAHLLFHLNRPIIRYIKNSPEIGMIKVSAENPRYEDSVLSISDIKNAYLIKGVIRREAY